MNFKEAISLAFSSLKVNKVRSFLTMLGIVIGVTSVILLVSIGNGLKTYITNQLEGLGSNSLFVMPGQMAIEPGGGGGGGAPGAGMASSKFTFNHLRQIQREAASIKAIMAYTENSGTVRFAGKTHLTQVDGVGPEYLEVRNTKMDQGSFFSTSQYNAAKRVVALGKTVAEDLFDQQNPVGKKVTISDQTYTVVGVLEEKGVFGSVDMDNQIYVPATTAMKQFDMEYIMSFWVQAKDAASVVKCKEEIEKILSRSLKSDEFSVLETKNLLSVVGNVLSALTAALAGIAAISLIVGGVGIMNIMLVSVTERTREIGLRKAVGATPKNILTQFLIEAVFLSFLGGAIGVILGILGSMAINHFFTTHLTFWSIFLAFAVSAIIGVVFGVAPAIKAAKLNPIDALRYE